MELALEKYKDALELLSFDAPQANLVDSLEDYIELLKSDNESKGA